jgi:hypothetical protein
LSHDEVAELLGAFALDAVDADEALAIRAHIAECPRCAAEVSEHHEVAGLIANAGVDAPTELWDRIAARINEVGGGQSLPPPIRVVGPTATSRRPRARRSRVVTWSAIGTAAAAVVAVIAVLGVQVGHLDQRVSALSHVADQRGMGQAVQAALLDPSARRVALTSATPDGGRAVVLVILPGGTAFALNTGLPPLAGDRTYQLWGVEQGRTVSLGLLGRDPRQVAFTVDTRVPVTAFAVTAEVAGGVAQSTHAPVAKSVTGA